MATRAYVGLKQGDKISVIYSHSDGYPEYLGKILRDNYKTEEQVKELLAMGDASFIGATIDDSIFYHRDRGETLSPASSFRNLKHLSMDVNNSSLIEYIYIFENGEWTTYNPKGLQKAAYATEIAKQESAGSIAMTVSEFFEKSLSQSKQDKELVISAIKDIISNGDFGDSVTGDKDRTTYEYILWHLEQGNPELAGAAFNQAETGTRDYLSDMVFGTAEYDEDGELVSRGIENTQLKNALTNVLGVKWLK